MVHCGRMFCEGLPFALRWSGFDVWQVWPWTYQTCDGNSKEWQRFSECNTSLPSGLQVIPFRRHRPCLSSDLAHHPYNAASTKSASDEWFFLITSIMSPLQPPLPPLFVVVVSGAAA